MKRFAGVVAAAAVLCQGCGNNLAGPSGGTSSLQPPSSLQALSIDSTHVGLKWTAAPGATDTSFRGYVVSWGITSDTIPGSAASFTAGSLARGAATFSIRSLLKSGQISDPASITWAPAWRYDASPITVTEYNAPQQTGIPGLDVGTGTSNPKGVGITEADADSTLDLYLYGPSGSNLQFFAASVYNPGWHQTLFSTTTTQGTDLNVSLASFPPDNTFSLQSVAVSDNTIYFVKAIGNTGELNYARVHVRVLPGSYPNRAVEVRISLQKVTRLPYA